MIVYLVTHFETDGTWGSTHHPRIWCATKAEARAEARHLRDSGCREVNTERIDLDPTMTVTPKKALCKILNQYDGHAGA